MKKKLINTIILIIILIALGIITFLCINAKKDEELTSIKSSNELLKIYEGENYKSKEINETLINIATMPFSIIAGNWDRRYYINSNNMELDSNITTDAINDRLVPENLKGNSASNPNETSVKDYSTTNIQVENVDEADITKTDGDYIYSISENDVIITNVINPEEIKIEARISGKGVPEDLILYKDKLVIISEDNDKSKMYYNYSSYNSNTIVEVYDIEQRDVPKLIKSYQLNEPYYTSRCINNKLYVIASGTLRKENNEIKIDYYEDNKTKNLELDNIKYLKDINTKKQTLFSMVDLDDAEKDIKLNSYLIDISNAYISENSIYLLDQKYDYRGYAPPISSLFGLKGILGPFEYENEQENSSGYKTEIYKFDILKDGQVKYSAKTKIEGKTINQYSLDEANGHLRIALYDDDGARVVIFDENLKQIGITQYVAKGEKMYSSRFIGDKAYLVTYKTVDPLFVIDLSDEKEPRVLGELKIPGYSTYLYPYDENHLIGIGMETEEVINRNSSGKVTSTTSKIVGMKMALFDVTDVNNPKQISSIVIGDRRTTSAILTNPKALLFSKEKNLIAIPVNNYSEDFEIESSSNSYSTLESSYKNYNKNYVAEGYFVYNIDIENGFKLKGTVTHEVSNERPEYNYYYNRSRLLRGLYIEDNLYTVSETNVKVNNLDTLELISELKIK